MDHEELLHIPRSFRVLVIVVFLLLLLLFSNVIHREVLAILIWLYFCRMIILVAHKKMHILLILVESILNIFDFSSLIWIVLRCTNNLLNLWTHSFKKVCGHAAIEGFFHYFQNLGHLVGLMEDLLVHPVGLSWNEGVDSLPFGASVVVFLNLLLPDVDEESGSLNEILILKISQCWPLFELLHVLLVVVKILNSENCAFFVSHFLVHNVWVDLCLLL